MKDKLSEYGFLVGEEHQQVRRRNMECLLVRNTNKGVKLEIFNTP